MGARVGIHGIGSYLPEQVRPNDWWPAEIVAEWRAKLAGTSSGPVTDPKQFIISQTGHTDESHRRIAAVTAQYRDDPFDGVIERRVLPAPQLLSDMAVGAAREAFAAGGVAADQIDLMLVTKGVPLSASGVHRSLGLGPHCRTVQTRGECNEFLQQLALAEQAIASGRARFALLIQGGTTRGLDPKTMLSARFGDGATAVIVGPVGADRGIIGQAHLTDGSVHGGFGYVTRGGKRMVVHQNPIVHAKLILALPAHARRLVDRALEMAALSKRDVQFWASHRAAIWMQPELGIACGLEHAAQINPHSWTGNLAGANIPLSLLLAQREGLLSAGTHVVLFALAAGSTATAVVVRWGTA